MKMNSFLRVTALLTLIAGTGCFLPGKGNAAEDPQKNVAGEREGAVAIADSSSATLLPIGH
jgi:hypothetical protein